MNANLQQVVAASAAAAAQTVDPVESLVVKPTGGGGLGSSVTSFKQMASSAQSASYGFLQTWWRVIGAVVLVAGIAYYFTLGKGKKSAYKRPR